MAGRGQATLHLDGKEIFSIQLNERGKVSDRIAELRGEVMTKLNAHMGANAPVTDEVDMLEEPVSGDEGEDSAAHKKGKKKRRRNQQ